MVLKYIQKILESEFKQINFKKNRFGESPCVSMYSIIAGTETIVLYTTIVVPNKNNNTWFINRDIPEAAI